MDSQGSMRGVRGRLERTAGGEASMYRGIVGWVTVPTTAPKITHTTTRLALATNQTFPQPSSVNAVCAKLA